MDPDSKGTSRRLIPAAAALIGLLAVAWVTGLSFGSSEAGLETLIKGLSGGLPADDTHWTIIRRLRLPRVLLATLAGAALSLGGLVFQCVLRNPLAEPYILGVSGGAAVGAIIGILLGLAAVPGTTLMAFGGALVTMAVVLGLPLRRGGMGRDALLLAGVMVNAFCSAIIMFLVAFSQDARLHRILFWLMGRLDTGAIGEVGAVGAALTGCFVFVFIQAHRMNLLALGRAMAQTTGVDVHRLMIRLMVVTSLMVALTVSLCGLIGFVGLVIPHLMRLVLGPDHRVLVPAAILGGGAYLTVCDTLARTLPHQGELPVGVITAAIGAPLFIVFLWRSKTW